MTSVGRRNEHAGQTTITLTSMPSVPPIERTDSSLQVLQTLLDRLDVRVEVGLPQRDPAGAERLALLAEAPAPIACEVEPLLRGERVGFSQFLQARRKRPVTFFDALEVLRDRLFVLFDLLIALRKKLVLARDVGNQ